MHVNWVKAWLQVMNDLFAYVKQYHTTGVAWNSAKKSQKFDSKRAYEGSSSSSAPAPPSGPLPPPPPPMPNFNDLLADDHSKKDSQKLSTDKLFAEINKGGEITSMLKKVSDDQKVHKNPNLRSSGQVPAKVETKKPISNITSASSSKIIHDPVFELVDKKWKIEFQNGNHNIVVDQTDMKHTVYIYKCKESTITVKGKVNSILIDSCNRVGLLFDDVLSTVEFINSTSVQMQAMGIVPTVTIEKTDGCQVYLNKNTLQTEIVSSKSSAMNVLVPDNDNGEFVELPVPEQFKTVITADKKLKTQQTEMV
jgi:adenylyl cyclase-associated protein